MYSQFRGGFWDRIRIKNNEMNYNRNHEKVPVGSGSAAEWDLTRIELQTERGPDPNIPTIDLEDEDEVDSASVRREAPLRGFDSSAAVHSSHVSKVPSGIHRSSAATSPTMADDEGRLVRRSIQEYREIFGGSPRPPAQESAASQAAAAATGIIFNRAYKKPVPSKENYFSILDTVPSPGVLSAASIFGERSASTEPKIVMTANHYEKKIIRRSFDKPASAPVSTSRQVRHTGPYKLLGVIDLEPDTESEATDRSRTPSVRDVHSPTTMESSTSRKVATPTNSALHGCPTVPRHAKASDHEGTLGKNKILTIEIDEDDDRIDEEDTRMELSEEENEPEEMEKEIVGEPTQDLPEANSGEELQVEQCTLSDSETSSTAQMNPSSRANSFWDVSSSGCVKMSSDNNCSTNKHTEFDLLLDKINQQVPAMSQQDRIEHWRVTKEDLLYSIPTVAEIESGTSIKRPMDDPIHISSSDSSCSATSDSPSLIRVKQKRENCKKRRTGEDPTIGDRSLPSLHLSEDLDFRRSQINPEIDKGGSMIQMRKNYYKFPTRFNRLTDESPATEKCPEDPYVNFLSNESEKEKFTNYLRRNPAYRPDLLAERTENKVAVVIISPLKVQQANEPNVNNSSVRQQPERSESADRLSRYRKNRTKTVGRTLRYKVRKPQLKKKSIMMVPSNLRSYRRLVMKSSLRNGKVRKKASFVNLLTSAVSKQKQRTKQSEPVQKREQRPRDAKSTIADERLSRQDNRDQSLAQSSRVSVDSAVSSSTSAEHKRRDGSDAEVPSILAASELRTMKNPLSRANGDVLMVFYVVDKLIVVQQEMISFWECSKLSALLGLKQEMQLIGQTKRAQTDSLIDSTNTNRLGFNEDDPFYLEPRARNLDEDDARLCPLASIYVNCYSVGAGEDDKDTRCIKMKSLQLDSIRSELPDILFVPLPRSVGRYFMICWHEQLSATDFRTGLCKYSLTPDLETLASIREFPSVTQKIVSMKCLDDDRLIGLGSTTIAIWSYDNGYLMFTVDLKVDIEVPLATFIHTENDESALFLIHLCPSLTGNQNRKLIKVIGINMSKRSWHQIHSYEIALESNSILSESLTLNSASIHCTTFQSGELLAISLDDLTTCFTNYKRLQGPDGKRVTRDNVATREKIFLTPAENRHLVLVSDKFIKLKTIDEYALVSR